jgi:choice-of-anchor B domain-containing protein
MTRILTLVALLISINTLAQSPCENGSVNGYPCNQVDFYSNLDNATLSGVSGTEANDIWGWTDSQSGDEYAIVGQTNGTVFVNISDPVNPVVVGRLPSESGFSSLWRDIKVFNDHAFIVADNNPDHGMQVFDLRKLNSVTEMPAEFEADAVYNGVSSAHNVVINESKGFAYIVGATGAGNSCGQGGLHIVDIRNPKNPQFAGCFDVDGYTHDAQCVVYNGPDSDYQGQEICFNANENTITIANVEDKSSTFLIAKSGYPSSEYAHQGWLTEDHDYFLSNDELDEARLGFSTRTLVWDVRDLDNPVLINQYFSERSTIDHNLYVKGDKVFQSNYTSGLVILDIDRINRGELRERAFFDTHPNSNATSFNGSWSNYPYFESGIVIVSDINRGLFVLQPNYQDLILSHPIFEDCTGDTTLSVEAVDESTVDTYQWQTLTDNIPEDIENNEYFSGAFSSVLSIKSTLEGLEEMIFRCKVTFETGEVAYSYLSNNSTGFPAAGFNFEKDNLLVKFSNNTLASTSFEWDFGDGSEISTESNPEHIYSEVGTYEVTLTAYNDCGSDTYTSSVNLSSCLPNAAFTYEIKENEVAFSSLFENVDEYFWDFGDGSPISNEAAPTHTYEETGTYSITLTVSNECGENSLTETINLQILNIEDEYGSNFRIYPNPVENILHISNENDVFIEKFEIFDQNGKRVSYSDNVLPSSNLSIEMSQKESGIYYLVLTHNNGKKSNKKILKK